MINIRTYIINIYNSIRAQFVYSINLLYSHKLIAVYRLIPLLYNYLVGIMLASYLYSHKNIFVSPLDFEKIFISWNFWVLLLSYFIINNLFNSLANAASIYYLQDKFNKSTATKILRNLIKAVKQWSSLIIWVILAPPLFTTVTLYRYYSKDDAIVNHGCFIKNWQTISFLLFPYMIVKKKGLFFALRNLNCPADFSKKIHFIKFNSVGYLTLLPILILLALIIFGAHYYFYRLVISFMLILYTSIWRTFFYMLILISKSSVLENFLIEKNNEI